MTILNQHHYQQNRDIHSVFHYILLNKSFFSPKKYLTFESWKFAKKKWILEMEIWKSFYTIISFETSTLLFTSTFSFDRFLEEKNEKVNFLFVFVLFASKATVDPMWSKYLDKLLLMYSPPVYETFLSYL